jgi:hypothetical protein
MKKSQSPNISLPLPLECDTLGALLFDNRIFHNPCLTAETRAALWGEKGVIKAAKRSQKGGAMGAKRRRLGGAKAALFPPKSKCLKR